MNKIKIHIAQLKFPQWAFQASLDQFWTEKGAPQLQWWKEKWGGIIQEYLGEINTMANKQQQPKTRSWSLGSDKSSCEAQDSLSS